MDETPQTNSHSFSDYRSVSLVAGLVAGLLVAWPGVGFRNVLAAPVLLCIPGVVRRSKNRILLAGLLGIVPLMVSAIVGALVAPGRDLVLPLTVWEIPGGGPNIGTGPMPWQVGSLLWLLGFMVPIDILMMLLRDGGKDRRGLLAMVAGNAAVVLLYPLSWFAMMEPRSGPPLSSFGVEVACVTVFVLIFPMKYMLMNYLYAPELFTRPYGEGNMADAEAWWP